MDRVKIKEQAKKLIKNNLWNLWKPYLIIMLVSLALSLVTLYVFHIEVDTFEGNIADAVIMFITLPLTTGYTVFLLKFVRGKKAEINDVFSKMNIIVQIFVVNLIVSLAVSFGCVLLIVPGIIVALMFSMVTYLLADGENNIGVVLSKSVEMMKGYKWDFFVFCLSFIGWVLLGIITFGLAYIYVLPYINVSTTLYYEELKKKQIKKA